MPRLTKIIANISNRKIYDAVSGAELSTNSYPYTSAKELSDIQIQYVTDFTDINDFTPYTLFTGQTISSSAVIDNDYNHIDKGLLAVALVAGPITQIEILASSLDNIPQISGTIQLINAGSQTETVAYTSVSLVGDNYVFVVDVTLSYSYDIGNQANTNDPPLVKSTAVDTSGKDTGLFVIEIDTNTQPYLLEVEGKPEITSCKFEQQIRDNTGQKIFEFIFPFVCKNSLDDDGALPPPVGFNFYTKLEIDALLDGYLPRSSSTVDVGSLLNADDYFPVYNKDTNLAERYKISDIATGAQTPPVQNIYVDNTAMFADQLNQTANYLQQSADKFYKKKATSTGSISDYDEIGAGEPNIPPVQNSYANTTAMIADQGNQTSSYLQKAGTEYYEYLGTIIGDITDYQIIGSGVTDDLGVDTGVLYGLTVSINADTTKVDISSGAIFIRDYITDPQNPVYKKCVYDGDTAIPLTYLATDTYTQFVAVEDLPTNAGKVRIEQLGGTEEKVAYYKDRVKLQQAIHVNNTNVIAVTDTKQIAYNKINDLVRYTVENGAIVNGVSIIDNGLDDLSCTKKAGTAVAVDINSVNDNRYSSEKSFAESQAEFLYNYRTNVTDFVYETNLSSVLKPSLYNNLTTNTVDAVPAGKFTIQRCFFFPVSNTVGIAYGQKIYDSQEEAVSDIQNGFIEAPTFEDAVLVTAIICKSGATSTKNKADILFAQSKREYFDTGLTNISIRPGFLDVNKSQISYNNATRTLTLTPIAPNTTIKVRLFNGVIIERASFSWTNTDVEGLHYFYIDSEGLEQVSAGPNRETINNFLRSTISVSFLSWGDGSFNKANIVTDFRKRSTGMSPDTVTKNFFDVEIYALDGVSVTNFPVSPTGALATDAQFGFATDELLIGDRQFNFHPFSRGDTWRVLYMEGSNVRHIDKPLYAFLTGQDFALVGDYPVYNNNGTTASATPPNANSPQYVYYIMGVVNEIEPTRRMITWMGNNVYTSQANAEAGLANEISRVESLSGIKQEFRATYAVLYEVDLDYTNTHSVVALDIVKITTETSVGGSTSLPSGLVDGSNADSLHKHEAQALQASTLGVNDSDDTVYLANGSGLIKKEIYNPNSTHTGEVTGSTILTVNQTAISNKTLKSTLAGSEEVLINDAGVLKKTTSQDIAYLGSYTPPITENAVVDTNALTANTVTNTLALDGTLTIPDTPTSHGVKYFVTTKGSGATGRIKFATSGNYFIPTFTDIDEIICIEGSINGNTYKIVR